MKISDMKNLFSIGEILWIRADGQKHPIKIIDFKIGDYNTIVYTLCSARDDAKRNRYGQKDNYYTTEPELKKLII